MMLSTKSKMKLPHSYDFEAIGTKWSIDTMTPLSSDDITAIHHLVNEFDYYFSRFRADSLVTHMSKKVGSYAMPDWSIPLWEHYEQLYQLTDGKVTPLIGDALVRAGYDETYSFVEKPQIAVPMWQDVIQRDGTTVTIKQPALLDVGAAGKGFLVDRTAELLEQRGYQQYVIDASGDICHKADADEVIGLEHPHDSTKIIGTVKLKNQSLCASAVNRRRWGSDMHHMLDPHTVVPTREIVATWVIADTTMRADGIATALFFTNPDELIALGNFEFLRIHQDGMLDHSPAFKGQLV